MISHPTMFVVMSVSGVLGGIVNYYMVHKPEEQFSDIYIFSKSIFLGLAASALVPLFLKIIGSEIIVTTESEAYSDMNYYFIGGFCLSAAIASKSFIEDIYSRVSRVEKEAKEAKQTADEAKKTSVEAAETNEEVDAAAVLNTDEKINTVQDQNVKNKYNQIISAILDSRYSYRTVQGLAEDTKIPKPELTNLLQDMKAQGILTSRTNRYGNDVYKYKINR